MSCREARRLLSARLDGRLEAGEGAALEAHLAGCPACRRERARWEASAGALRAAGPTPVPPGLAERAFRAAMDGAPARDGGFVAAARRVALAGAVAAAAVWLAALATGAAPRRPASGDAAQDPIEVAVLLWTAGGERDAE